MTKSLIPPRYVNLIARTVYDDIPPALFQTWARLSGLAWQDAEQLELPRLSPRDLGVILHCNERTVYGHLRSLRDLGWLTWRMVNNEFYIRLSRECPPPGKMQSFATADDGTVVEKEDEGSSPVPGTSTPTTPVPSSPGVTERRQTNLSVMSEFGIDTDEPGCCVSTRYCWRTRKPA